MRFKMLINDTNKNTIYMEGDKMEPKKKVIEIHRVSTKSQVTRGLHEDGEEQKSELPRQVEIIKQIKERYNLEAVKTFELIDVSGSDVLETSEMQEVIELIKSPDIDGVVVAEFDRLIRADFDNISLLKRFEEANAKLYSIDGVTDFGDLNARLFGGIKALMAGDEKERIKNRMRTGKETRRRAGLCPDSDKTLPTGVTFDKETKKFKYNADAEKVRKCFEIVLNGGNFRDCERATGIRHRTVSNLLRNRIFMGERVYEWERGKEKYHSKDGRQSERKKVRRPQERVIVVKAIDSPLISLEDFNRVQSIVNNVRKVFHTRRTEVPEELWLHGSVYCGVCGSPMYTYSVNRNGRRRDCYFLCKSKKKCYSHSLKACNSKWIRAEVVSNSVLGLIRDRLSDKAFLVDLIEKYLKSKDFSDKLEGTIIRLTEKISDLEGQKKKYITLYVNGRFTEQELNKEVDKLTKEINTNKTLMNETLTRKQNMDAMFGKEQIESVVTLFKGFELLNYKERRDILKKTRVKIFVKDDAINGISLFARESESISRRKPYNPSQQLPARYLEQN